MRAHGSLASLLFAVAVTGNTGAQIAVTGTAGWLRATIEAYPERERRPILNFLDGARPVADQAARDFQAGRDEALLRQLDAVAIAMGRPLDSAPALRRIRKQYGGIESFEFRCQALEGYGPSPDVHDLTKAASLNHYAVVVTKQSKAQVFLEVRTVSLNGHHQVSQFALREYWGATPPWLLPKK